MKHFHARALQVLVLGALLAASQQSFAQAGGVKPELVMYRHNGSSGTSPLPALTGDLIGTVKWNALTAINAIRTGATIQSVATQVAPGVLQANMFFGTSGNAGLTNKVVITPEGLVGIGELNPTFFNLHVKGNTHTTDNFYGRIHFDKNETTNDAPNTYDDEAYFELKNRGTLTSPTAVAPGLTTPTGANPQGGILSLAPGGTNGNMSLDHQLFFGDEGIFTRRKAGDAPDWTGAGAGWYKLLTSESISGHGGRLPRFTGPIGAASSSLGDSQLFDDGTNVTIGGNHPPTPPPAGALDANYRLTINGLPGPGGAARINGRTFVDGRLGVGNNAPAEALDVTGNAVVSGNTVVNGNLGINTAPAHRLDVNGDGRVSGNLGVGTAPTTNRVEVLGNTHLDGNLQVDDDARVSGKTFLGSAVPTPPHAGALIHTLYVGGSMICTEAKVELVGTWPDYVFEENYPLAPLAEKEKFVRENKHLPGVPTAKEVAEDGLPLGAAQHGMTQNLEEAYLYLFEMEKRMKALESRVQQLEAENTALKNGGNK